MSVGLRVWDRRGQLLTDMTMRYPKLLHNMTVTVDTDTTINYTPPQSTTLLVVPVYLGRNDEINRQAINNDAGEGYSYTDTYRIWRPIIDIVDSGFKLTVRANHDEQRVPIKIYWGYL